MPPHSDIDEFDETASRSLLTRFEEYAACWSGLIQEARQELLIFDPDGRQLALDKADRIEALFHFLRGAPTRRAAMVVHEVRYLEADCPRFVRLAAQFGGQIEVRVTCGEARRTEDCFVIADAAYVLRRPVAAQPRGVLYERDPAMAAMQRERYEQIWRETEAGLAPGALGLA